MADFSQELQKLMQQFAPSGGFGIPNVGGIAGGYKRDSESAFRQAMGQEGKQFERAGLGNSVARAFSPGTRKIQFNQELMEMLTKLYSQHGQLAESQRQNLLGMFAPIAEQRANRPSWLSTLLGGALGIGAQVAIPGIGNKIFGNPLMSMFGSPQSSGYRAPAYNPMMTNMQLDNLDFGLGTYGRSGR